MRRRALNSGLFARVTQASAKCRNGQHDESHLGVRWKKSNARCAAIKPHAPMWDHCPARNHLSAWHALLHDCCLRASVPRRPNRAAAGLRRKARARASRAHGPDQGRGGPSLLGGHRQLGNSLVALAGRRCRLALKCGAASREEAQCRLRQQMSPDPVAPKLFVG